MTTLDRLNAFEAEQKSIVAIIAQMGRDVADIVGIPLKREIYYKSSRYENFGFDGWERIKMEKFYAQEKKLPYWYRDAGEDEDYNEVPATGERLIAVSYGVRVGDGYESRTIYFPESYLDNPEWPEIERGYAAERQRVADEKAAAWNAAIITEKEKNDRALYEQLKERYGD